MSKSKKSNILVLGNGISRKELDLHKLKEKYIIYGCNALWRDFAPDILFVVDDNMLSEVHNSSYCKVHKVISPCKYICSEAKILSIEGKWKKWNCGSLAVLYACQKNPKNVYLAGFDVKYSNGKYKNIYAGTAHYANQNSVEQRHVVGAEVNQLTYCFQEFPEINFYRLYENNIPEWESISNLTHVTTDI